MSDERDRRPVQGALFPLPSPPGGGRGEGKGSASAPESGEGAPPSGGVAAEGASASHRVASFPGAARPAVARAKEPAPPPPSREEILAGLDGEQGKAVLHERGPLLLVAGAGSGKTRAIVARIVRLVGDGVPPKRIVGITFTNRAAEEMRERVSKALSGGETPWLGTFHAFGALLLRRFGARAGISPNFLIYDQRDQLEVLRGVLQELNVDEKKFPANRFADLIERSKRGGVSVEEAALSAGWLFPGKAQDVADRYEKALAAAGAVDFNDLIRLPAKLFRERPDVLEAVRGEVRHLLVDEFQDVDAGQAEIARALALGADSFCAVGDEDQSIYGWRGGSAGPMLSFERDYPGAAVIHLSTNYRTRAAILDAASAVISRNSARREKAIVASREGGEAPRVRIFADADLEGAETAAAVAAEIRRGTDPSEVAVFYRVNAQSRPLEDALRRLDVPYVLRGALSFYDRAVVRDAVAYLKWYLHPDDLLSLRRLLKAPRRGVGEGTLRKVREETAASGEAVSRALARLPQLSRLFALRDHWLSLLPGWTVGEALSELLDRSGYLGWLSGEGRGEEGSEGERQEEMENVRELLAVAASFPGEGEEGVRAFLETVSLSSRDLKAEDGRAVRLMTLHNAKGLEFDSVFLVGLEEGLLPHSRSQEAEDDLEEERRLFYVGLTRARERAVLSFARRRFLFGSFRDTVPSRFLLEIPPHLVRWDEGVEARPRSGRTWVDEEGEGRRVSHFGRAAAGGRGGGAFPARRGTAAPARPFGGAAGQGATRGAAPGEGAGVPRKVRHPVFGEGKVEGYEGDGAERKLFVRFAAYGLKKILERAVRMEVLE
jgi:DNA helicase-2/ATP-dependent DNA helicase PcrA